MFKKLKFLNTVSRENTCGKNKDRTPRRSVFKYAPPKNGGRLSAL